MSSEVDLPQDLVQGVHAAPSAGQPRDSACGWASQIPAAQGGDRD